MTTPFTAEQLSKMRLIRNFEEMERVAHISDFPIRSKPRISVKETGYKFTVHAENSSKKGCKPWYSVVKHDFEWDGQGWKLTRGEVACNDKIIKCLSMLRVF